MIKSIQIENFQPHKNVTFDLHPGVNVFMGQSRAGKSSIIRLIKWILTNRPSGQGFKSWFADNSDVLAGTMLIDDTFITRERGKDNCYIIEKDDKQNVFKALGSEIPQEVQDVLQMNSINLQSQHDGYFLLQKSPGEVAKEINKVLGLEIIDKCLTKCTGLVNKTTTAISIRKSDIESSEKELEGYVYLKEMEKDVDILNKEGKELDKLNLDISLVASILDNIQSFTDEIEDLKDWLKIEPYYIELHNLLVQWQEIHFDIILLADLIRNIESNEDSIKTKKKFLKVVPYHNELNLLEQESIDLDRDCSELTVLLQKIDEVVSDQATASDRAMKLQVEYDKMLADNKICPLCGKEL